MAIAGFMLAAAGCQSGDSGGAFSGVKDNLKPPPEPKVLASELQGYCPKVTLREGTAYFNTYVKGGQGDPEKVIYQASLSDATRSCSRASGMLTMNVAVAGKVVPGPVGAPGSINMPIRVAVTQGDTVLYSQLHQYQVAVGDATAATQFVFSDPAVVIPIPQEQSIQVFAGFDEGPPKKDGASKKAAKQ